MLDTSVWLDLAENQKLTPLLDPLINLMSHGHMSVIVPQLVRDEFAKNRKRVAERAQRSLSSHFNVVRDAIRKVEGDGRQKDKVLAYLGDIDHRIPLVGGVATNTLDRIEKILNAATPLVASDEVMLRAAARALQRKAPCHHENKNSMADAVLVELYFECVCKGISTKGRGAEFKIDAGVLATEDFIAKYPEVTARLVKQLVRAAHFASQESNREAFIKLSVEHSGNPELGIRSELEGENLKERFSPLIDDDLVADYQRVVDEGMKLGLIKQGFAVKDWFAPQFVQQAVKDLKLEKFWTELDAQGKAIKAKAK